MEIEYKKFDTHNSADARSLAMLHRELLSHSPVALLGSDFMEKFYYSVLPGLDLISGIICYVNGQPAGFIVATDDPAGFMKMAVRKRWYYLIYILAISVIKEPSRIKALWEAWQIMSSLPDTAKKLNSGELLSLGVLPEYRTGKFQKKIGYNISKELVDQSIKLLKKKGCTEVRVVVDDDNTVAKFFYHSLGWSLGEKVTGWKVPTIEFITSCNTVNE